MALAKRLAALLAALALVAGNGAVCQGWTATRQGRMACCAEGLCAMSLSEAHSAGHHGTTQGDADRCCAASESDDSGQAVSAFVLIAAAILPTLAGDQSAVSTSSVDAWRVLAPTPPIRVARHLLLSVFLV